MMRYLISMLLVLLISSCSSTTQTNYYQLADAEIAITNAKVEPADTTQQILITVTLPDYLNTTNMVYQGDDIKLYLAQSNLWAENPESAIARLLINDLSKRQAQVIWLSDKTTESYNKTNILVSLDKFNGVHGGQAIISGRWFIRDGKQQLIASYPINIKITQYGDGYAALAQALNQGVHKLAAQISDKYTQK